MATILALCTRPLDGIDLRTLCTASCRFYYYYHCYYLSSGTAAQSNGGALRREASRVLYSIPLVGCSNKACHLHWRHLCREKRRPRGSDEVQPELAGPSRG